MTEKCWRDTRDVAFPPPPVRPKSRLQVWAAIGVPACSVEEARERIRISRLKRATTEMKGTLSVNAPVRLLNAIDAVADRYGVSRSQVVRKFIEDGLSSTGGGTV